MPRKPNTPRLDVDVGQEETDPGDGLQALVLAGASTSIVHCSSTKSTKIEHRFSHENITLDTFGQ